MWFQRFKDVQKPNNTFNPSCFFFKSRAELKTFEWWISGLMINPLFFLISRLNIACSPLIFNFQINYPIRIKDIPFKSFQLWAHLCWIHMIPFVWSRYPLLNFKSEYSWSLNFGYPQFFYSLHGLKAILFSKTTLFTRGKSNKD